MTAEQQHVVSVMPRQFFDDETGEYGHHYRALCACGKKSPKGLGKPEADRWANGHMGIVNGTGSHSNEKADSSVETTESDSEHTGGCL